MIMKESIKVLQDAVELQRRKANDYQNPHSSIKQADYYPRGCASKDAAHEISVRSHGK